MRVNTPLIVKSRAYLLDVVIAEGAAIFKLLSSKDQSLLVRGNSFLVLDLGLDIVDGVGRLHLKGDSLARDCAAISIGPSSIIAASWVLTGLDEDLHSSWATCRPWADSCRCLVGGKVMEALR